MTLSAEELGEILEATLAREGLYVTNCEYHEGALHVGYESPAVGDGVPREQVGTVLRLLLDLAGIETEGRELAALAEVGDWDPEDVEVWAFDDADPDDRVTKGHYEVREGWFRALDADYLSETDFSTLVLSTLE